MFCIFGGFSILGIVGFGTVAWLPTYFIRVHGWSPQQIGYVFGAILSLAGGAGVLFGGQVVEFLQRRGYRDAYVRLPLFTVPIAGTLQFIMPFVPNDYAALGLAALFTFLGTLPLPGTMASIQVIAPNQMRGQVIAFYLFIANILGTACGPTVVALFTDYVFRDEMKVGYSLSATVLIVTTITTVLLYFAVRSFGGSLDRAKAWEDAAAQNRG
jgi:MFS family permease